MGDRLGSRIHTGGFFIIFVDRMFTTFIERPFTNASGAITETLAMSCLSRACNAD
jgi:hypothetical protein